MKQPADKTGEKKKVARGPYKKKDDGLTRIQRHRLKVGKDPEAQAKVRETDRIRKQNERANVKHTVKAQAT